MPALRWLVHAAYGRHLGRLSTSLTDIGFTGHRHNNMGNAPDDIGLIYMQARWYVPGVGRFASADTIVPDPTNPQSYNRYSYVLNRPLNFSDPTGHRESDGCDDYEGCSLTTEERRESIRTYTNLLLEQRTRTSITDVEIFAQVMDFAAGFNTNTQEWANDLTYVVNGTTGLFTLLTARPGEDESIPAFGDTGFHPAYRDFQNQIYHWWAYVNTGAQGGFLWANTFGYIGNEVHEFWDFRESFRQPDSGSSWQDYALAGNGLSFGQSLYYGYTTPDNAGDVTRWMLTTDQQRPVVRWMADNVGNNLIPTNILRSLIEALP